MIISVLNGTQNQNRMSSVMKPSMNSAVFHPTMNSAVFQPTINGNDIFPMGCTSDQGWSNSDLQAFNGASDHEQAIFELALALGDADAVAMNGKGKFFKKVGEKLKGVITNAAANVPGALGAGIRKVLEVVNISPTKKEQVEKAAQEIAANAQSLGIDPNPANVVKMALDADENTGGDATGSGFSAWWAKNKTWGLPVGITLAAATAGVATGVIPNPFKHGKRK